MRAAPPDLPGSSTTDSPVDRGLALFLADEHEAALRWSAAVVHQDPGVPSALILTCRLLAAFGREETAKEGLELAIRRSIASGNLPLAVAGVADLSQLGVDVSGHLDEIAESFSRGSERLSESPGAPPPLPALAEFEPLSPYLTGPALLSKATGIIHEATRAFEDNAAANVQQSIVPLPLFSALDRDSLRALIETFETITVPAGYMLIEERTEGAEAYIVVRGELEVVRHGRDDDGGKPITLARLTNGSLVGEMALLSRAPRAASVRVCRPSLLLVARRDALEAVAGTRPEVGTELAAHCRRRMVENLIRTSQVLKDVHPDDRPALVDRFETNVFEKGEKLIVAGEESKGLHLVASGEVAVVGEEAGEPLVLATLGVGEVVGEVALVLRRQSSADVVAVHPTVTLHLPRQDFMALIGDHPAILKTLYLSAARRDEETSMVIANSTTDVADDYVLV